MTQLTLKNRLRGKLIVPTTYDLDDPRLEFIPNWVFRGLHEKAANNIEFNLAINKAKHGGTLNCKPVVQFRFSLGNAKYNRYVIVEKFKIVDGEVKIGYTVYNFVP